MSVICKNCNNSKVEKDHTTGELVCANCGAVAEESRIVSEVAFSETSGGRAVVSGQYVSNESAGVLGNTAHGVQGESRVQTIAKARHRMEVMGQRLGMPEHIVESGVRNFRSALAHNFVKGRKSQHVLSACLYLACRLGKTDHMLMDFAELIHVNVFNIGATYLQLLRNQNVKELPIVDPTVYIQRFTAKLQFGAEGGRQVAEDAKKLVIRMGKDWLHQGRRPAGVAAACILLAARMNNFRRSKAEIVSVAKIAEETLQRRLNEFKRTQAGTLTVHDFRNVDVESAADPPSFTLHRELEKKMMEKLAHDNELRAQGIDPDDAFLDPEMVAMARQLDKEDGQTIKLREDVDSILENPELLKLAHTISQEPRRLKSELSDVSDSSDDDDEDYEEIEAEAEAAFNEAVTAGAEEIVHVVESTDGSGPAPIVKPPNLDDDSKDPAKAINALQAFEKISKISSRDARAARKRARAARLELAELKKAESERSDAPAEAETEDASVKAPSETSETAGAENAAENASAESAAARPESATQETSAEASAKPGPAPTKLESLTSKSGNAMGRLEKYLADFRKNRIKRIEEEREARKLRAAAAAMQAQNQDETSLSDVDDEEIESVILTEREIEEKSRVWMSINREYLIEQERKRLRREAEARSGEARPRKKRRPRTKTEPTHATTAEAGATSMLKEKAPSKKINYAAVSTLFSK